MSKPTIKEVQYWILLDYYSSEFWLHGAISSISRYASLSYDEKFYLAHKAVKDLIANDYLRLLHGIDSEAREIPRQNWDKYLDDPTEWLYDSNDPRKNNICLDITEKGYVAFESGEFPKPTNIEIR